MKPCRAAVCRRSSLVQPSHSRVYVYVCMCVCARYECLAAGNTVRRAFQAAVAAAGQPDGDIYVLLPEPGQHDEVRARTHLSRTHKYTHTRAHLMHTAHGCAYRQRHTPDTHIPCEVIEVHTGHLLRVDRVQTRVTHTGGHGNICDVLSCVCA